MNLERIQAELAAQDLDGWLLYDFKGLNAIAADVLGVAGRTLTRRWFCLIPRRGDPRLVAHAIERSHLADRVPGEPLVYAGREQLCARLEELVATASEAAGRREGPPRLAMEYSPLAAVPTASRVDAGTVELVRASGADVVSSADLIQAVAARWSARGLALHREAAAVLTDAVRQAFAFIGERLKSGAETTEIEVVRAIRATLGAAGITTDDVPMVSANAASADPHYQPTPERSQPIRRGDFVLIDVWGKNRADPDAVYADITWVGFCAERVPDRVRHVFEVVRTARDRALALVQARLGPGGRGEVRGYEVDREARAVIAEAGFGDRFTHRTGHSLGPLDHWIGANIDDFETHDDRRLIPETGFTIEPGIYIPGEFGVRSEIDVYIPAAGGPVVTTPPQHEVVAILASTAAAEACPS